MKHALRKYLSPCGSALFMVVSTMAALIVLVTAMYMSVISSRQVQYASFDQEQAYVTSTSVADIVTAYIRNKQNSKTTLMAKLNNLSIGQSVSTNGNDFTSLSSSGTKADSDIGAYDVDITRLDDETVNGKNCRVYDLAVTVEKNGIVETTHLFIRSEPGEASKMDTIDRFFTNTGYLPNDVWISSVTTDSTLYCDNEYTEFKTDRFTGKYGGNGDVNINMDIVCAGAASFNDKTTIKPSSTPLTWVFGNTLTIGSGCTAGTFDLSGKPDDHAKIIVGGDLIIEGNRTFPKNTDVYVLGNVYIKGYMSFEGDLYVNKDIIFMYEKNQWSGGATDFWSNAKDVYINGNVTAEEGAQARFTSINIVGKWTDPSTISEEMDSRIGGSVFPKWEASVSNLPVEDIIFQSHDDPANGFNPKFVHYINEDCIIGKVEDLNEGSGSVSNLTIVIDTGDDPDGIRTLQVSANSDEAGYSNTFMWYPKAAPSGGKTITVLTVGRGSLVIDVPEGVTYQATDQEFFGHLAWFMMSGGYVGRTDSGAAYFARTSVPNPSSIIHNNDLILEQDDGTCEYEQITGSEYYTCKSHGGCYAEHSVEGLKDNPYRDTLCLGRILKDNVDDYYYGSGSDVYSKIAEYYTSYYGSSFNGSSGYSQGSYYPNVNIFVVSILENADIQFGCKKADGADIKNNVYFGYVYAPYMSYVTIGSGGGLKTVGGVVVSDMLLSGAYEYIFAQPERTIEMISGENLENLSPSGSRAWRIHGY